MIQVRTGNKLYTSGSKPPRRSMRAKIANAPGWVKWPACVYVAAVFGYLMYCEETQTGLIGYLMAREMEYRGTSTGGLEFFVGLVVLMLPLWVGLAILDRVAPGLMNAAAGPAIRVMSWGKVFGITAIPLAATAIAIPMVSFAAKARLNERIYEVNLENANGAALKEGAFVELNGQTVRRYVASYRYGNHRHSTDYFYTPFTASTWRPADPVRFILYQTASVDNWDQQPVLPYIFSQQGVIHIQGRLKKSLPVLVARKFADAGLSLAPEWFVLTPEAPHDAFWAEFLPAATGVSGVGLTLFTLLLMTLIRFRQRNRMARAAGA